ncbi:hypothetical protein B0T26DRAFT_751028 [Lasiosphaeria miniovina]|uniref:Uncharacterized protein n=1 Tax=Lasiosphaeria miniovina TaxID=1954250 RepID=A0AA40DZ52_9PEZI|nr:uncharacterized protein B0T26DRAFT_751028 [Lasiosphaeria miniovina]KAK0716883.1 hypothetical protein B0T26DRAFT_751028 [Lasiosphaeria miniovina]
MSDPDDKNSWHSCPGGGSFYVCGGAATGFVGCCTTDPCVAASGGKCLQTQSNLRPAKPSIDRALRDSSLSPRAVTITATIAPAAAAGAAGSTTTTLSSTTDSNSNGNSSDGGNNIIGLSRSAAAGVVGGAAALLVVFIAAVMFRCGWRARRRQQYREQGTAVNPLLVFGKDPVLPSMEEGSARFSTYPESPYLSSVSTFGGSHGSASSPLLPLHSYERPPGTPPPAAAAAATALTPPRSSGSGGRSNNAGYYPYQPPPYRHTSSSRTPSPPSPYHLAATLDGVPDFDVFVSSAAAAPPPPAVQEPPMHHQAAAAPAAKGSSLRLSPARHSRHGNPWAISLGMWDKNKDKDKDKIRDKNRDKDKDKDRNRDRNRDRSRTRNGARNKNTNPWLKSRNGDGGGGSKPPQAKALVSVSVSAVMRVGPPAAIGGCRGAAAVGSTVN